MSDLSRALDEARRKAAPYLAALPDARVVTTGGLCMALMMDVEGPWSIMITDGDVDVPSDLGENVMLGLYHDDGGCIVTVDDRVTGYMVVDMLRRVGTNRYQIQAFIETFDHEREMM